MTVTNINTKNNSGTKYLNLVGKIKWAKIYKPEEFRGAIRWTLNFFPENEAEWEKIKAAGLQKKHLDDKEGDGKYLALVRSTTKLIKGKIVNFAPPVVYGEDGKPVVQYTDAQGKAIRSYDDADMVVNRVGEPVMIGNGSKVMVTLAVYPTAMGPGNRLESIKILDLIHYEKPETPEDAKEEKSPEIETTSKKINDQLPPW